MRLENVCFSELLPGVADTDVSLYAATEAHAQQHTTFLLFTDHFLPVCLSSLANISHSFYWDSKNAKQAKDLPFYKSIQIQFLLQNTHLSIE